MHRAKHLCGPFDLEIHGLHFWVIFLNRFDISSTPFSLSFQNSYDLSLSASVPVL